VLDGAEAWGARLSSMIRIVEALGYRARTWLSERRTGRRSGRTHDGKVAAISSNQRLVYR